MRSQDLDARAAHQKVLRAVRSGRLVPLPCEGCGRDDDVEAHHDDYAKALNVKWLCPSCHALHHRGGKREVECRRCGRTRTLTRHGARGVERGLTTGLCFSCSQAKKAGGSATQCQRGHIFDEKNTMLLTVKYKDGTRVARRCRACENERRRKR